MRGRRLDFSSVRLNKFFDYGDGYVGPDLSLAILIFSPSFGCSQRQRVFIPDVADLDGVICGPMSVIPLSRVAVSILARLDA
jgi:hypothetical protein